jgi:hypothetical protein
MPISQTKFIAPAVKEESEMGKAPSIHKSIQPQLPAKAEGEWLCTDDYQEAWLEALEVWRLQGADQVEYERARKCILTGIPLDFQSPRPTSHIPQNTKAFTDHQKLCEPKLQAWAKQGKIRRWSEGPFKGTKPLGYVPLHAVIKPEKVRVVVGAHVEINPLLPEYPFVMSTIGHVEKLVEPNCLMFKLDIQDAFLSWRMSEDAQKHLAFHWNGEIWYFTAMPFGLSSGPFWNDLMMRVLCAKIKEIGIRHSQYCDDIILIILAGMGTGLEHEQVKAIFRSLGINNNEKKQSVAWAKQANYLGYTLDSLLCCTLCTEGRRQQLLETVREIQKKRTCTLATIVTLTGRLAFASSCFPASKQFYNSLFRYLSRFRHARNTSKVFVRPPLEITRDLGIWELILTSWNGRRKWLQTERQTVQITSDASLTGYGFFIAKTPPNKILRRGLTKFEACAVAYATEHICSKENGAIQWGELLAIAHAFVACAEQLRGSRVIFETDNLSNVGAILSQRSTNIFLRHLLRIIYFRAAQCDIDIRAIHIPGEKNVFADWLSRPDIHKYAKTFKHEGERIPIHHIFSEDMETHLAHSHELEAHGLTSIIPNYPKSRR